MPRALILALTLAAATPAKADLLPPLRDSDVAALANEISGEAAKRNLEGLARHHRMRGSSGFRAATDQILAELKRYGFADAHVESFPADGKIYYGTQRSRPGWDAAFAELWEVDPDGNRKTRLASWEAMPMSLAQDSADAEVRAALVDVGAGTADKDYEGKDVRGKLVLTSSQPGDIQHLAVEKFGAAGFVSYAQNQRTAWWKESEDAVRWGHIDGFAKTPTFGFMVSLRQGLALQERLAGKETVLLDARVKTRPGVDAYEIATATIPGSDSALRNQEIIYSCHLDHPRPGANDNASGCAAILEVARTLSRLVADRSIAAPRRTIRFVWPPEIEGTHALLNGRPQFAANAKAVVHLDMVGGGPETKAIFHITRGPASQPSFINDIADHVGRFVNAQSAAYAMTGEAAFPLVASGGGKEALLAQVVPLTMGSDHQVYADSTFGIPVIYLNDWPDRYIHTTLDTPANIDPTRLERAAFIAAASGYILANLTAADARSVWSVVQQSALNRAAKTIEVRRTLPAPEAANLTRFRSDYERRLVDSFGRFFLPPPDVRLEFWPFFDQLDRLLGARPRTQEPVGKVYRRNPAVRGPLTTFGHDPFIDRYGLEKAQSIRLHARGEYAYEALNLVDGKRTVSEIRDALSAMFGPVPAADVEQYLAALAEIGVIVPTR
jgi:aminopeptidase YwaD